MKKILTWFSIIVYIISGSIVRILRFGSGTDAVLKRAHRTHGTHGAQEVPRGRRTVAYRWRDRLRSGHFLPLCCMLFDVWYFWIHLVTERDHCSVYIATLYLHSFFFNYGKNCVIISLFLNSKSIKIYLLISFLFFCNI